ncbi:segregation/condensation protein A [Georgenia sp. SUBG003]|uniref:segregation/condensation protein A n=1 Tax=Georgenia sp. SUBG003 TaxID=1497974 RepID=UPI003AB703DA
MENGSVSDGWKVGQFRPVVPDLLLTVGDTGDRELARPPACSLHVTTWRAADSTYLKRHRFHRDSQFHNERGVHRALKCQCFHNFAGVLSRVLQFPPPSSTSRPPRLLPRGSVEDDDDLELLARDLLFARLLQYRAFKQVAAYLGEEWGRERPVLPAQRAAGAAVRGPAPRTAA